MKQTKSSVWENKPFRKMFGSYALSSLGDWFDMIAMLTLFTYVWQTDSFLIALVPIMYAAPGILFGQVAGVLVDRWNKLRLMIIADLLRAALTVGLIFAPDPFWALAVMFVRASVATFNAPAQQALVRNVVAEEHLLQATSMNGMVFQAAKVFGPLLGAGMIAFATPHLCLIVTAVALALSAIVLMTIGKIQESEPAQEQETAKQSFFQAWQEGWGTMLRLRALFASLAFFLICFTGLQMIDVQVGVLIRNILPDNPEVLGFLMSLVGIGTLAVALLFSRLKNLSRKAYGWLFGSGSLVMGGSFALLGSLQPGASLVYLLGLGLMLGIGSGLALMTFSYVSQIETPKALMGRISGIINTLTSVVVIASPIKGSSFISQLGVETTFLYVGLFMIAVGVVAIVMQRVIWGAAPRQETDQNSAVVS